MRNNKNLPKTENDTSNSFKKKSGSPCSTCGAKIIIPLLTLNSSNSSADKYYACSNCLSKCDNVDNHTNQKTKECNKSPEIEADNKEESLGCRHHLGYLKRRPKNTPIPEDCFTCSKMIDCLSK